MPKLTKRNLYSCTASEFYIILIMVETAIKPALYKHKKFQKVNHNNLKVLNYPHLPEIGVPGISCDEYLSQHTDHDSVFELKALNKFN